MTICCLDTITPERARERPVFFPPRVFEAKFPIVEIFDFLRTDFGDPASRRILLKGLKVNRTDACASIRFHFLGKSG